MTIRRSLIKTIAGAVALGAALWAAPAAAVTIPITFETETVIAPLFGTDEFTGGLGFGDTFSLDLSLIPEAAPAGDSNPTFNSVTGLVLTTPTATLDFNSPPFIPTVPATIDASVQIFNGDPLAAEADSFILQYFGGVSGSAFFYQVTLNLIDEDGTAFSNADVPGAFDFALFETANIKVTNLDTLEELHGNVLVSAVPVPAALPLMLSGLAGIAFLARRRKKTA